MPSHYIHGTAPHEQARLAAMNDWINSLSRREAGIRAGERILDVGSGLGQLALLFAQDAGRDGLVLGIERAPAQLASSRALARPPLSSHTEFREGDALAPPLSEREWGAFDVAHTRFLLEHISDPARAVSAMVRAVRPGGRIILEDDDHDILRLWPACPEFDPVWHAYVSAYAALGADPIVGRRLVQLLHQAGAHPTRNTWLFFGSCAGNPTWSMCTANLLGILDSARPRMIEARLITPPDYDTGLAALRDWITRPDAAMWYAIAWAEGVRPA
jgi:SAM-dependent methyltransferase